MDGKWGRRLVTSMVTADLIEKTLGGPAVAEPIRVYACVDSGPLGAAGRAGLVHGELARMGALDRSYLLLVSPAGTGRVDQALIESAELLTRGDIATCVIQSGRMPSVLRWQQASAARRQFRAVLSGLKEHMSGLPPERRPKVLLSGRPCRREYRADTARLVHAAFALPPVAEEQMQAVEHVLGKLALDRGSPRRPAGPEPAGPEPAGRWASRGRWTSGGGRHASGRLTVT
jgi:hypothetical protein